MAGEVFEAEVTKAIAKDSDVNAYVQRLEQRYDAANQPSGEIPNPEVIVKELEEFLKSQRQRPNETDDP